MCRVVLPYAGSLQIESVSELVPPGYVVLGDDGPGKFVIRATDNNRLIARMAMQDDGLSLVAEEDEVAQEFYLKFKRMHNLNGSQVYWAVLLPGKTGYKLANQPSKHSLPDSDINQYGRVAGAYLVRFYLSDLKPESLFARAHWSLQDEPLAHDLGPVNFDLSIEEGGESVRA